MIVGNHYSVRIFSPSIVQGLSHWSLCKLEQWRTGWIHTLSLWKGSGDLKTFLCCSHRSQLRSYLWLPLFQLPSPYASLLTWSFVPYILLIFWARRCTIPPKAAFGRPAFFALSTNLSSFYPNPCKPGMSLLRCRLVESPHFEVSGRGILTVTRQWDRWRFIYGAHALSLDLCRRCHSWQGRKFIFFESKRAHPHMIQRGYPVVGSLHLSYDSWRQLIARMVVTSSKTLLSNIQIGERV